MSSQPPNSPQPPFGNQPYEGQPQYQQPYNQLPPYNQPPQPYNPQQQPMQPGMYPPQQPMQPGMYPPQQPMQPGMYPPQQPMQPGMYPPQQPMMPQQPPKKKRNPLLIGCGAALAVVLVIIVIVVIASAASSKSNTGTVVSNGATSTTGNTQATTAPATQSTFKVGQVVSVGNTWQITVLSAKTDTGGQYNTLQTAGDIFLIVTVSVKNISSQSQTMSSIVQWNLQDTTGQKYNIGIDLNAGAGLDGAVAAGMPLKGTLTYEVPKTIKTFTLSFQNDITSSNQTIWTIAV